MQKLINFIVPEFYHHYRIIIHAKLSYVTDDVIPKTIWFKQSLILSLTSPYLPIVEVTGHKI